MKETDDEKESPTVIGWSVFAAAAAMLLRGICSDGGGSSLMLIAIETCCVCVCEKNFWNRQGIYYPVGVKMLFAKIMGSG